MDWSRVREALRQGSVDPFFTSTYHGGGKGSAPPTPDYKGAAQAQGQANVDAAIASAKLSNPNIINPYGSQTVTYGSGSTFDQSGYDQALKAYQTGLAGSGGQSQSLPQGMLDVLGPGYAQQFSGQPGGSQSQLAPPDPSKYWKTGGDPLVPTVTQKLSEVGQQRFDQNNRIDTGLGNIAEQGLGYVKQQLDTPFNQDILPERTVNAGQTGQDAIMARLQPQMDRSRNALENKLVNQGFVRGSEGFNTAMDEQGRMENDAYTQAALQGIQLGDQARNSAIQEQSFFRNEPLNMLNAVRSASPVNVPQFQGYQGQNVQAAPIMQGTMAGHNAAMQNYGMQQAGNNSFMSGLFQLGAGGLAGGYF